MTATLCKAEPCAQNLGGRGDDRRREGEKDPRDDANDASDPLERISGQLTFLNVPEFLIPLVDRLQELRSPLIEGIAHFVRQPVERRGEGSDLRRGRVVSW